MATQSSLSDASGPEQIKSVPCTWCGGDGKETCNNPDHGFIKGIGGEISRLGCPVCGYSEDHKVPNGGDCENCNGTGQVNGLQASDRDATTEVSKAHNLSPPDNTNQSEGLTGKELEESMGAIDKVTKHCDKHNTDYIGGCPFCQFTKQETQS